MIAMVECLEKMLDEDSLFVKIQDKLHDLMNPLCILRGKIELIEESKLNCEEELEGIKEATERAIDIAYDLRILFKDLLLED